MTRRHRARDAYADDPYADDPYYDDALPAPRRRRRTPLRTVFGVGLLLVLIVVTLGGILLWGRVSAFNDTVSTAPAASSALFGALGGSERVNVILYGYGGEEQPDGTYLADSIQIVSIDPATEATTIVPIPRDLWIEGVPEIPDNAKINEVFAIAHARGGLDEAASFTAGVLSDITGLEISHWIAIDFAGFREMVDAVGGVTVTNPITFSFAYSELNWRNQNWTGGTFEAGELELDGQRALEYARARYTSVQTESTDFARSVRQQRVLAALRSKLGEGGLGSLGPGLAMMDALEGRMQTDLSAIDLFLLSGHLNPDRRIELAEDVVLQATTNTIGQYILVVIGRAGPTDYAPLRAYLATELAKPIPTASPTASP